MPVADHSSRKIVTAKKDAARMEIIRAGANYPNAVPSTYRENPSHPASLHSQSAPRKQCVTRTCTALTSRLNTRPMPAFGATRDEGAVGPVAGLSIYADVARLQCRQRPMKPSPSIPRPPRAEPIQTMAKGPTADTIISMIADGKKPPVPEEWEIDEHKKWLSKISISMATAVSAHRQNLQNNLIKKLALESGPFEIGRNSMILPDEIPGHYQTWSKAFTEGEFSCFPHPSGPDGARYPENYPPGIIESLNEHAYDHSGSETETTSFLQFKTPPMVAAEIQTESHTLVSPETIDHKDPSSSFKTSDLSLGILGIPMTESQAYVLERVFEPKPLPTAYSVAAKLQEAKLRDVPTDVAERETFRTPKSTCDPCSKRKTHI